MWNNLGSINRQPGFTYTQLTQQFGNNTTEHRTTPINWFVEDTYRVAPRFTLSYGLRWEYRFFPALNGSAPLAISRFIPSDTSNFAPRFGFVWQPARRTVLRGGYGIFYDTLNLRLLSLVNRSNGAQVLTYVVNGTAPNGPVYPNALPAPGSGGFNPQKSSVYGFAQGFKTQNAHQANLQVEQEIARDLSVTVGA